jgi:DNA repair exonuclease SbcCD ATPase subunit
MISGQQTLASIDGALNEARGKVAAIEARIAEANARLTELQQAQTGDYRGLARLRVDLVADGTLIQHLDQAEAQVARLMEQRRAALADLEGQVRVAEAARAPLEAERAAQAAQVEAAAGQVDAAQAKTQARLDADPAYVAQWTKTQEAERIARHAAEKAKLSEEELSQKGESYRSDPLFMYLWGRNYGLPGYRANGLIRSLDGKVANLIGYADARANYARLNEIPRRLREHATTQQAAAETALAALTALDTQARMADGIPAIEEAQAKAQAALDAIDARLAQADADRQALLARKAAFATGEDEHTRSAVDYLAGELARDDLMELRREAMLTPFPEDDTLVGRMLAREDERRTLDASIQGLREVYNAAQFRAAEVEALRQDFKRNRYDRAGSGFGDDAIIVMMLGQFLNGMLDRNRLWKVLQEQQRYRPQQSDPTFGSGGFGRGSVWGSGDSHGIGRGGGFGGGGGGFRTGGGF